MNKEHSWEGGELGLTQYQQLPKQLSFFFYDGYLNILFAHISPYGTLNDKTIAFLHDKTDPSEVLAVMHMAM